MRTPPFSRFTLTIPLWRMRTSHPSRFLSLYNALKLLGYVRRGEVFSQRSVTAMRTIKCSAMCLVGFLLGAEAYFLIVQRAREDIAGGVMIGLFLIVVSVVVATAAAVLEKRCKEL